MSGKYGMINKRESLYGGGNIMRVLMFFIALLCFVTAGILGNYQYPGHSCFNRRSCCPSVCLSGKEVQA